MVRLWTCIAAIAAGLGVTSVAFAQGRLDLSPIIAKVKPSVALIQVVENGKILGNGSGFVVDAKGMIATNFHVVDGAKELIVTFPADKDKRIFAVKGFVGILPGKDMALIMIDPKDKVLTALPLAKAVPAQGEPVVAFGAPLGLSDTVTDGIVSAIREGADLRDMLKRGGRDEYKDSLGYDLDIHWIQTSAPISPGNSGGPLVNARGEVIGINSFVSQMGQNLNFSLSTLHLQDLITKSGTTVQPLSSLPPPRKHHAAGPDIGDTATTLDIWKQLNKAKNSLAAKIAVAEKKIQENPELDSRMPAAHQNKRNKKVSKFYRDISKSYSDFATTVKALKGEDADKDLILAVIEEGNIAEKLNTSYGALADAVLQGATGIEAVIVKIKQSLADINSHHDVLRVNLSRKYGKPFPTLQDTAKDDDGETDNASADDTKKDDADGKAKSDVSKRLSAVRTWVDSTGKFKIDARFRGTEGGKAKLEKSDGTILRVPLKSLSEEDRRLIEDNE
jgi:hypothetical protein